MTKRKGAERLRRFDSYLASKGLPPKRASGTPAPIGANDVYSFDTVAEVSLPGDALDADGSYKAFDRVRFPGWVPIFKVVGPPTSWVRSSVGRALAS